MHASTKRDGEAIEEPRTRRKIPEAVGTKRQNGGIGDMDDSELQLLVERDLKIVRSFSGTLSNVATSKVLSQKVPAISSSFRHR